MITDCTTLYSKTERTTCIFRTIEKHVLHEKILRLNDRDDLSSLGTNYVHGTELERKHGILSEICLFVFLGLMC